MHSERFLPSVVGAAAAYEATCQQRTEILVADDASEDARLTGSPGTTPDCGANQAPNARDLDRTPTAGFAARATG